jgi:hypothetical protein
MRRMVIACMPAPRQGYQVLAAVRNTFIFVQVFKRLHRRLQRLSGIEQAYSLLAQRIRFSIPTNACILARSGCDD